MIFEEIRNDRLGEKYYTVKHSSGLRILVCPKEGFRSTYAVIGTLFGSINKEFIHNGKRVTVPDGTAHYLEHKLFESEDGDAFKRYSKTGASANAYTGFDKTCYLFSSTEQFEESLEILTSPERKVSTHVVIDTDGTRYVMADPDVVTFHAGLSMLFGREHCNYCTIQQLLQSEQHGFCGCRRC